MVANTAHVARAVADGAADIGFVEGECTGASLIARTVARDRLMLVAAPAFRTVHSGPPTDRDLIDFPWVLHEPGSGTRSEFEAEIRRRGIDPASLEVSLTLPTNEAVVAATAAGGGVAALSAAAIEYAEAAGRLRVLDPAFHERPLQILRRGDRTPSGSIGTSTFGGESSTARRRCGASRSGSVACAALQGGRPSGSHRDRPSSGPETPRQPRAARSSTPSKSE